MATYTGTSGNDYLVGTAANDLFLPLHGLDTVAGGGGFDTLGLAWGALAVNGGLGTIAADGTGAFSGSLTAGSLPLARVQFSGIAALSLTLSAGSDVLWLDAAPLAVGATASIDGGAGLDTLNVDFSAFSSTSFVQGANFLIASSHGSFAGFEAFGLTLGNGANTVALQGGNDTIRSTGGVDQIDGGAGRDLWLADFSTWSSSLSFGWDGDRNLAAVSNGAQAQRIEGGSIVGGSADDAFFLNGRNPFTVNGGAGRDLIVRDENGLFTENYTALFTAGTEAGSFTGTIRGSAFSSVEQVNVALSDGNNIAFVDTAPLAAGATMNLDGGGGIDELRVDFSSFAATTFALDPSGTAQSSHGVYGGFEHFAMALGQGENFVTLGEGDDTVYSLGGVDQVDAGAGFDFWGGDWSDHADALTFACDGATGSATLVSVLPGSTAPATTTLAGFETGYLVGGSGNDSFTLSGLMPFDVTGGAGFDTLVRNDAGLVGANTAATLLAGGPGWFAGWLGNGQFDGIEAVAATLGAGDDSVFVDAAPLASGATLDLDGGSGNDILLVDFSALSGTIFTVGANGTAGGNRGTFARFERFSIVLGGGASTLFTGAGNDTVQAAPGGLSATIDTGAGDDEIHGSAAPEQVWGGAGVDRFHVAASAVGFVIAQDGLGGYLLTDADPADGLWGTDRLTGVEWIDFADGSVELPFYAVGGTFTGTAGADTLTGTAMGDSLLGLAGNDRLDGGGGNDTIAPGAGNDTVTGGSGVDMLVYDDATAAVRVNLSITGKAQLTGGSGSDWLVDAIENLAGSAFNDTLTGNALANRLIGNAGNDTLDGGLGADTLSGGLGNDRYVVDDPADSVIELPGEGTDTVTAKLSWTLGENLENLTLLGTAALNGTGNDSANLLTGNPAANQLRGGAGKDTISGGAGADLLVGGAGADLLTGGIDADVFRFDALGPAIEKDTIRDFVHGADRLEFDRSVFTALVPAPGGLFDPAMLALGTAATTTAQHLVYNQATGALFYDADGKGGAAQVPIALLATKPVLDAGDIWLL